MSQRIREILEDVGDNLYRGTVHAKAHTHYVDLVVARGCEAELALLLKGAAEHGIIRLDRILPFLEADAPSASHLALGRLTAMNGRKEEP